MACSKDDENTPEPINSGNVTSTLTKGPFYVSFFKEDGNIKTSNFNNYTFVFDANGGTTVNTPGGTATGTWSVGNDDSKTKVVFNFGAGNPLEKLNEDWEVLSITNSQISMRHISGGNGGVYLLTISRI